MTIIELPLPATLDTSVRGFILGIAVLVLCSPLVWHWRLTLAISLTVLGLLLWRNFCRKRPYRMMVSVSGSVRCTLVDGRSVSVLRVQTGIVTPWLLSATLWGESTRCLLFVPGPILTPDTHRQLRSAILNLRPEAGE